MKYFKKGFVTIIMILVIASLFAQNASEKEAEARRLYNAGAEKITASNFAGAIEDFKQSLALFRELESEDVSFEAEIKDATRNLWFVGNRAQNWNVVTQYGEEYLAFVPGDEEVVRNLAQVYRVGLRNTAKAIEIWTQYDERFNSFVAKRSIGEIYERDKDVNNAILWFNKALEMNRDGEIVGKIAKLYADNKEPQKAIQFYQDYIDTNPPRRELGMTYRRMGRLYQDLNNTRQAIEKYELAMEIDFDRNITLYLVDQYYHMPNYNKARQHVRAMLQRNANDNDAIYFDALLLFADEKFAEAKAQFQKIRTHATYGQIAQDYIKSIDSRN